MADLHDRLVAALRARLEVARAATEGPWYRVGPPWNRGEPFIVAGAEDPHFGRFVCDLDDPVELDDAPERDLIADADHIAANDPAAEIRRVEALLRVVERHANPHGCVGPDGTDWLFRREAVCPTLADLAAGEGIEVEP